MRPTPPTRRRCFGGFTLVELLVVIGIIAVLISILLPSLASARRSANNVRCQASLKEIGNAFRMYALSNKGYYPPNRHTDGMNVLQGLRWTDMIARYLHSQAKDFTTVADITKIRRNSVLWGCPEWTRTHEYDPSATGIVADTVYNGYGMQSYVTYWEDGQVLNMSTYNRTAAGVVARRGYIKESVWTRRPSADRIIIADSQLDIIEMGPNIFSTAGTNFQPYNAPSALDVGRFYVDARHTKRGTPKNAAANGKSLNALFCDGHVSSVSVREAWNGIRNPGKDTSNP